MMKKYEAYKNSGVEWIGEIPEGWETSKIKYLLEQSKDGIKIGPFGSALTGKVDNVGDYKVYGQWNIVGKDFNVGKNYVSTETFNILESYHISAGDLFISMMGTVGKCAIIPEGIAPGIMDSHVVKARLDEGLMLPKFFEYVYDKDNSNIIYSQIKKFRKGSIMDGLNSTLIKEFYMPVPPLPEQQTIASYLDHKVGQIDASVSAINTQIEDLQAYRQSVISEAVTKGLNPDAKMKDSGIEWIGKIPEGWETSRIKHQCYVTDGTHFSPTTKEKGKPYITVSNVRNNTIDIEGALLISEEDFQTLVKQGCQPHVGDVLLSKDGTVGRSAIVSGNNDFVCLSSLGILSPLDRLDSSYLKYSLDSIILQEQMTQAMAGSALRRITISKINDFVILLPPLPEQQAIADYLDSKTSQIDTAIATLETQRADLNALKQSIISEAVTGKIDVRDWKQKN